MIDDDTDSSEGLGALNYILIAVTTVAIVGKATTPMHIQKRALQLVSTRVRRDPGTPDTYEAAGGSLPHEGGGSGGGVVGEGRRFSPRAEPDLPAGGPDFRVSAPGAGKIAQGRGSGRGIFNLQQNHIKKFSQTNTLFYE